MTTAEAIQVRKSRRSFADIPLTLSQTDAVSTWVEQTNRESGLSIQAVYDRPEWFGGFLKTYGLLSGVRHFLVLAGPKDNVHLDERIGYYGERLVLELTKLNLGTCWVGGSFDRGKVGVLTKPSDRLVAVIAFGNVETALSFRESIVRGALFRKKPDVKRFIDSDGTHPVWFDQGVLYASLAPSAVHLQPYVFVWKDGMASIRKTHSTAFAMVDLGIAKYHFEQAAVNGRFELGDCAVLHIG